MKEEWKKVKLGEISADIQTGPFGSQLHMSDYSEKGIPVVMPKDMINGKITEENIARVTDNHVKRLNRYIISSGNILYARRGDVGKCVYVSEKESGWLCGTGCLRININTAIANPKFVFFQLQKTETIGWVEKNAVGATMLNLNTSILANVPLHLPPLPTQQKIASVLSAYDDLIENNRKQIKLLEEAALKLYKEWFVKLNFPGHETTKIADGVPDGWKKATVEDLADYLNGYAFKPSDWKQIGYPIIKIKEMGQGITVDTPRNSGNKIPGKYMIEKGTIIFSWSATLSVIIWSGEKGLLNQHLFKVTPHEGYCREFVFQSIQNALVAFSNITTGATMKHIQRNKLSQIELVVPSKEIMSIYRKISDAMREKILMLQNQIQLLQLARDKLLPKLMNGEIEV